MLFKVFSKTPKMSSVEMLFVLFKIEEEVELAGLQFRLMIFFYNELVQVSEDIFIVFK